MCRVLSIKEDGKVDVSLRESVVKRGSSLGNVRSVGEGGDKGGFGC